MKKDPRRFAPIGLVISGLSLLAVLGVLGLRAFEKVGLFTPPDPILLDRILYIGLGLLIAGLAVYALLDPDRVRKFMTGRQAQYGSNSLVMLLAFVGILVVINMLVYQNPQRWDVTEDKQNTLAPETVDVLNKLPEPVMATAFYSTRLNTDTAQKLLEDFKANSKGKFDFQFVDPEANPVLPQQYGITGDGKILLQMGDHTQIVTLASEQELTNGLIRLLNPQSPVIYFLTGEGEHDSTATDDAGYSRAKSTLESKNYVVKTLSLQAENAVPQDAAAIVIAGPVVPLSQETVQLLDDYMKNGGSLIVMEDPTPFTQFDDKPDPLADYLNNTWDILLNNDIVVDTNSPSSPFFAVSYQFNDHPITQKMSGVATIFPYCRSITITGNSTDVTPTALVLTIDRSWGEKDFASIQDQTLSYDPNTETAGPMTLAAASENSTTKGRVVVFGSSSFAQNGNFDYSGNGDMFVNSVDWAAEQEDLISLTTSSPTQRTFNPPGSVEFILLIVTSVCLIPLLIAGAGFYAWIMRRRRG